MPSDTFTLNKTHSLTLNVRPLGDLALGAGEFPAAGQARRETLGMDGPHFKAGEADADTSLRLTFGAAVAGESAFNGYCIAPDLSVVRSLLLRCDSTAGAVPDFAGADETPLTGVTAAASTNLFTKAGHGLATGSRVIPSGFTGADGVTMGAAHWAIVASSSTFKLAESLEDALGGTFVDVTSDGTGGTITPEPNESLTFAFLSDCGEPGAAQTAAAAMVTGWNPDRILLVGDFTYNAESGGEVAFTADLAVFDAQIESEKVLPVCGNHEWDSGDAVMGWMASKFTYLNSFGEYPDGVNPSYSRLMKADAGDDDYLVHFIMLDPCLDSNGVVQHSGGFTVREYGACMDYILQQIASATARFRVLCCHFPAVTSVTQNGAADNGVHPFFAFLARSGLFDLIINGHVHSTEVLQHFGTTVLNCSSSVQDVRAAGAALSGCTAEAALLYSNSTARTVGKLVATRDVLTWEIHQVAGGLLTSGTVLPRAVAFGSFDVSLHGLASVAGSAVGDGSALNLRMQAGDVVAFNFRNGHPVNAGGAQLTGGTGNEATEEFTLAGHGLITGQRVTLDELTGGAGLTAGNDFFVIRTGADTFKLASSLARAREGTAEAFTTAASAVKITPFTGVIAEPVALGAESMSNLKLTALVAR